MNINNLYLLFKLNNFFSGIVFEYVFNVLNYATNVFTCLKINTILVVKKKSTNYRPTYSYYFESKGSSFYLYSKKFNVIRLNKSQFNLNMFY